MPVNGHARRPRLSKRVYYRRRLVFLLTVVAVVAVPVALPVYGAGGTSGDRASYTIGAIRDVSAPCSGAEVHQAVDPKLGYVYELWTGCGGIGFARSTDGGLSYGVPSSLPGSAHEGADDPAIAVAPDGTVYVSFMVHGAVRSYPVVEASFDHGASFPRLTALIPSQANNWGDADFLAVGPHGAVYVTWDYGPSRASIRYVCTKGGSCSFDAGDVNEVIQKSSDHGKSFGPMSHVSPGFPAGGADSGPLVVEPSGRIDVVYQGYAVTDLRTYRFGPASIYFTSSSDGGRTWSRPVRIGEQAGTMSTSEWWMDGDVSIDAAGNLYATWDTQGKSRAGGATDIGWLAFSTDHGRRWSAPILVSPDNLNVPHITEVVGARPGIAYVSWHANSDSRGYALYLRAFSVGRGWISPVKRLSSAFGSRLVWPGDTFGISSWAPDQVAVSWGSATPATGNTSKIFAAKVKVSIS